jgi:large subunit ribosomal protein L6
MSRIGRKPIAIPAGVEVKIDGSTITVKGPQGELTQEFTNILNYTLEGNELIVTRNDDARESRAFHGLTRSLLNNMVIGVSAGYVKELELTGVGYRATLKGKDLDLSLGYSHPVVYVAPEGISFDVPDNTHITVKGISKEQVGQVAAEIRSKRPPEPYKGKGIHYEGEHIRRKLGKAAK